MADGASTTSSSTSIAATPRPVPEPFGQAGVGRYAAPFISLVSLMFACFCGVTWFRSFDTDDAFERRVDRDVTRIDSVHGGIIVRHFQTRTFVPPGDRDTNWRYGTFAVPENIEDPWPASSLRTFGLEFHEEPIGAPFPRAAAGWWLGLKWRTLALLGLVIPFYRAARQQIRQRTHPATEVATGMRRWLP